MQDRPWIYIVDASVDVTGALVGARREARLLQERARLALVLPTSSRVQSGDAPEFEKIVRLPMMQLRKSIAAILLYLPSLLYCGWKLSVAMRRDGCSRLQVNDFFLLQGACARLFGFRGTLLTWVRIDPVRFGRLGRLWLRIARSASDRLVAVSAFIAQRLGGDAELIYDPAPEVAPAKGEGDANRIVFIANYIEGKGQDRAIAAFARIAERFPRAELALFGSDMGLAKNREYRRRIEEQAAKIGDRVSFGDFVEDTPAVLRSGLAALTLSQSESFSLTCQEASACGVAVIATRCGGPEEIIEDGETGFLVPVDDVDAIADRMATLLAEPELAREMGRRGAALVRERFAADRFTRQIAGLFSLGGS